MPPTQTQIDQALAELQAEFNDPRVQRGLAEVLAKFDDCCATCGEPLLDSAVAEVVRDGKHVRVHADTCMLEGEEVA